MILILGQLHAPQFIVSSQLALAAMYSSVHTVFEYLKKPLGPQARSLYWLTPDQFGFEWSSPTAIGAILVNGRDKLNLYLSSNHPRSRTYIILWIGCSKYIVLRICKGVFAIPFPLRSILHYCVLPIIIAQRDEHLFGMHFLCIDLAKIATIATMTLGFDQAVLHCRALL